MHHLEQFAKRHQFNNQDECLEKIKAVAFSKFSNDPTDEQIQYFLEIADRYRLNPFIREITALPCSQPGMELLAVVTDQTWCRILSEHPDLAGVDFKFSSTWRSVGANHDSKTCPQSIECILRKKGEGSFHCTEHLDEHFRINSPLWHASPVTLLKQKALIACARLALGLVEIFDLDEAERLLQAEPSQKSEPVAKLHRPIWPIRLTQEFCSDLQHYFGKPAGAQTFAVASIILLYFFK